MRLVRNIRGMRVYFSSLLYLSKHTMLQHVYFLSSGNIILHSIESIREMLEWNIYPY